MISSLLLTTVLLTEPELGPLVSPGTSANFQQGVRTVCEKLMAKDFGQAKEIISRLPKANVTYRIDWENVPTDRKASFETAIKASMEMIEKRTLSIKFQPVEKGEDILLSFAEELPVSPQTHLPQGLVTFQSYAKEDPAIEGVIALKRTATKVWSESAHIGKEAAFVLGAYFGLAETPGISGIASRTDSLATPQPTLLPREAALINDNLAIVKTLQEAANSERMLQPATATASIDTQELDTGEVAQGAIEQFQFGVYNRGNAPLTFWIQPDCSCFRITTAGVSEPGTSANVNILMDTSAFVGPQLKRLYVYTNDPDNPVFVIPVKSMIRPAYRFIEDGPLDSVVYVDETGAKATVYLTIDEAHDIKPHSIKVNGVAGTAVFEPWEGELPDPVLNEPPKQRKGYKITTLFSPGGIQGRVTATLTVTTNNDGFKTLNHNFVLQKGIAASPKLIYLGEIPNQPSRASTILTAPGRPFKITKVESRHQNVTTEVEELPGGDYRVSVQYDGKGDSGQILTSILVHTDSKESPVIEIPIQGFVK